MSNAADPKVVIQPRGLPPLEFSSLAELDTWAQNELQAWRVLNGAKPAYRRNYRASQSALEQMLSGLEQIRNAAAAGNRAAVDSLVASRQDLLVPSTSLPGQLIVEQAAHDTEVARMMLLLQRGEMGQPFDFVNAAPPWEVVVAGQLRLSDLFTRQNGESLVRSYSSISEEWAGKFSDLQAEQSAQAASFNAAAAQTIAEIESVATTTQSSVDESHANLIERLRTISSEKISQLDSLIRTFNEQLRLQAPATYWTKKASDHRAARVKLRWALGFTIVIFLAFTAIALKWLDQFFLRNAVHSLLLVSPAVLVGLWSARLVFRGYNRNNDLLYDAEQRAVMATTYLALTKEGAAQAVEAERLLILQALVRPEAISPDDVSAGSLVELAKVATQSPHR